MLIRKAEYLEVAYGWWNFSKLLRDVYPLFRLNTLGRYDLHSFPRRIPILPFQFGSDSSNA